MVGMICLIHACTLQVSDHICRLQDFVSAMTKLQPDEHEYAYLKTIVLFQYGKKITFFTFHLTPLLSVYVVSNSYSSYTFLLPLRTLSKKVATYVPPHEHTPSAHYRGYKSFVNTVQGNWHNCDCVHEFFLLYFSPYYLKELVLDHIHIVGVAWWH